MCNFEKKAVKSPQLREWSPRTPVNLWRRKPPHCYFRLQLWHSSSAFLALNVLCYFEK